MTMPSYADATTQSLRNSSSVPKAESICMLMRSKWPSTEGVARHPLMPPACFTGPVWTAVTPISEKACHRDSSPSELRKLARGAVMIEIGYAVNHTDPRSTAARGFGSAYGFCHMLPLPDNCSAINFASCRID
ncbi:Uncharacterised protein [Rhodococcus wratislaviensis]|uniref:Uncharacterized protein n=1 Tax=Rhodococcus wratislaviensis TaxID=44752 RepID=A0AB38FLP6_RHOWR|nr:Uncharacterised protein [Rhodococcus wratislaviensis]